MKRYFKLWCTFLKMSWMADLEYRLNITVRVLGEALWYLAQLSVFEVLYLHTQTISGWDIHAMRVFMASLFITDVTYVILFHENMDSISSLVRKGDLDLYLTKPVNSQFMVTCRRIGTAYLPNLFFVFAYFIWALRGLPGEVSAAQIASYILLVICGLVILYCLRFFFAILAIVLHNAANLQFIWYQFYRFATRPDVVFPFYLRLFILTVVPMGFIASVPARVFVDGFDVKFILVAPLMATTLLLLSSFAWRRALRYYASASS